jgi:signal transduction histidine kinase
MHPRRHPRQIFLFLAAVLLPCLLLIALSVRMLRQDRELAEKRIEEERRHRVSEVRQQLLVFLEQIKLQEVGALVTHPERVHEQSDEHQAVSLLAWVRNNQLVPPWAPAQEATSLHPLRSAGDFQRKIQEGERAELAEKQWSKAADLYRQALQAARLPFEADSARLALARTLLKIGERDAAMAHYQEVLRRSPEVTDDNGIPLALYAAGRLLASGANQRVVLDHLRDEVSAKRWMAPAQAYMIRELLEQLAQKGSEAGLREIATQLHGRIEEEIHRMEQVLALQNDFPKLFHSPTGGDTVPNRQPVWVVYGKEKWLVSLAPVLGNRQSAVVAVKAQEAFASLSGAPTANGEPPEKIQFWTSGESQGEALGPNFPGITVVVPPQQESGTTRQADLQRRFYFVVLLLVLSVTLFGAYLLWRDVRRELQMADVRSQFVSSVSHELKTPLTSIRMFAETLRLGRSADPRTQAEYLDTIVDESERLTRLLNNVLDFSKIEQGKRIYRPEPTVLPEVIQATVRAMQYALGQQGFHLQVDIENDLPPVRADRDALEQAILNLLTNAVKFSGESREIDLRLHRKDSHAEIQVIDRGVGIPLQEQSRIFEKFYRVRTPENLLIPGTGLGLTLVEHIAKAHGWRIKVESAPGKGSTFSLRIPLEAGT